MEQEDDNSPKSKTELSFDPANPLLGMDPRATRTDVRTDSNVNVVAVLLRTAQKRKQRKCPWMNECKQNVANPYSRILFGNVKE